MSRSAPPSCSVALRPTYSSGTFSSVCWVCACWWISSFICSQLPWSAVISTSPPMACIASTQRLTQASSVSTALTAASKMPVWPTMSQLA